VRRAARRPGEGKLPSITYEAVFFDFDGVLADSEPLHYQCWSEALRPLGITFDWDTYRLGGVGFSDLDLLRFLARRADPPLPLDLLWERYPLKQELFRRRALENPPIPPTTIELLKSLPDYKLAVVTSTSRSEVEPILDRAGVKSCFATIVCGEDVQHPKPAPDPYLLAGARLGVMRALVVEDSEAGLDSGREAGFDVLRITDPARTAELVRAKLDRSRAIANFR